MQTIILLDLNYTFVANSETKLSPFRRQIDNEEYRPGLIAFLRRWHSWIDMGGFLEMTQAILVTARPRKYQEATLASIKKKAGIVFPECYFNSTNKPPHIFKRDLFRDVIRPRYPRATFVAIESNPRTIVEYKKLGVLCLSVQ